MLAHSTSPYPASEERREIMGPLNTAVSLQDFATRPRSFDISRHTDVPNNVLPIKDETFGETNTYIHTVPQKQFHKSHSSAHRLVHPCMPVSNQGAMNDPHGGFNQNINVRALAHQPFASTPVYTSAHLANQQRPIWPHQGDDHGDIESGLGSSSSSGRSSASSLVRGAGESVLAGIDWAGSKLATLFGISQQKYHWTMTEHECYHKQVPYHEKNKNLGNMR